MCTRALARGTPRRPAALALWLQGALTAEVASGRDPSDDGQASGCHWAQLISCVSPVDTQSYYQAVNPGFSHLQSPGNC